MSAKLDAERTVRARAMALPEPQMRIVLAYLAGVARTQLESALEFLAALGLDDSGIPAAEPAASLAAAPAEPGITPGPPTADQATNETPEPGQPPRHLTVAQPFTPTIFTPDPVGRPAGAPGCWQVWNRRSALSSHATLQDAETEAGSEKSWGQYRYLYAPDGCLAGVWRDGVKVRGPEVAGCGGDDRDDAEAAEVCGPGLCTCGAHVSASGQVTPAVGR